MDKTRFAFWTNDCTIDRKEVREWRDGRLKPLGRSIQQSPNDSGRTLRTTGGSRSVLLVRDVNHSSLGESMVVLLLKELGSVIYHTWSIAVSGSN